MLCVCMFYREQIEVCVEILRRVLQVLDLAHLARNCRVELQSGLKHPDHSVKVLALTQVRSIFHPTFAFCFVNCFHELIYVFVDWAGAWQC